MAKLEGNHRSLKEAEGTKTSPPTKGEAVSSLAGSKRGSRKDIPPPAPARIWTGWSAGTGGPGSCPLRTELPATGWVQGQALGGRAGCPAQQGSFARHCQLQDSLTRVRGEPLHLWEASSIQGSQAGVGEGQRGGVSSTLQEGPSSLHQVTQSSPEAALICTMDLAGAEMALEIPPPLWKSPTL